MDTHVHQQREAVCGFMDARAVILDALQHHQVVHDFIIHAECMLGEQNSLAAQQDIMEHAAII